MHLGARPCSQTPLHYELHENQSRCLIMISNVQQSKDPEHGKHDGELGPKPTTLNPRPRMLSPASTKHTEPRLLTKSNRNQTSCGLLTRVSTYKAAASIASLHPAESTFFNLWRGTTEASSPKAYKFRSKEQVFFSGI